MYIYSLALYKCDFRSEWPCFFKNIDVSVALLKKKKCICTKNNKLMITFKCCIVILQISYYCNQLKFQFTVCTKKLFIYRNIICPRQIQYFFILLHSILI